MTYTFSRSSAFKTPRLKKAPKGTVLFEMTFMLFRSQYYPPASASLCLSSLSVTGALGGHPAQCLLKEASMPGRMSRWSLY